MSTCQEWHYMACSAFEKQDGPVIPSTKFFFHSWHSISASVATYDDLEVRWEQSSLTQVSSALHHQPTFLEADESDAGIHQELWEDLAKFFHDQILQTGQYQRVSVC